jgi:hypothetical protein
MAIREAIFMFHLFPHIQPPTYLGGVDTIELFAQSGIGEVAELITPDQSGRIRFRASFWPAELYDITSKVTLPPTVKVIVSLSS